MYFIELACDVLLRMIPEAEKHELTAEQRNDLDVATATAKRVIAVALSDLRCRNPIQ